MAAGIAPAASLIVVHAWDADLGGLPDEAIVRGVRFCRAVAALDDGVDPERLVVLLALGGHDGPHDGSGSFERGVVDAAGGAPIVVAAGNDGERAVRAAGLLFSGERETVELRVPRPAIEAPELALTVRLQPRGEDAAYAIVGSAGTRSAWRRVGASETFSMDGADVVIEPIDGTTPIDRVTLRPRDPVEASGTWAIELRGPADAEVWLARAHVGPTFFTPTLGGSLVRTDEQIAIPATAPEVVAVGSTIARPSVRTLGGELSLDGAEVGEVAAGSSRGPSASGAPKPDLVAPGGWLLAALGRDVRQGELDNLVGGRVTDRTSEDGRVAVRGSSASAAVVAGALLLALELDPGRVRDARALLVASASDDSWSPDRGWGELDVERLLTLWSGDDDEGTAVASTRAYVPGDPALWLTGRASSGEVIVTLGERRWVTAARGGAYQLAIEPALARVGEPLLVSVARGDATLAALDVPVVLDRSPRGAVAPGGGACATSPGERDAPGSLGSLALVLLALRGRRGRRRPRRARCDR
jgi:hypothetical protein